MKNYLSRASVLVIAYVLHVPEASAHHSAAIYDTQNTMPLAGSVVRYEWGNPHVYVHIATQGSAGQEVVWVVETGSPTMMERRGWSADMLQPGDQVTAQANPARNQSRQEALLTFLQKADGAVLLDRNIRDFSTVPLVVAPVAADSLSGNWLPATQEFQRFSLPLSEWPLTEAARTASASYTELQNGSQNCVSTSAPYLMAWTDLKQIELREDTTIIRAALVDAVERVVHMEMDSHDAAEPTNQGHSIGHWEGNALIVDTTKFAVHASGIRGGVPSSPQKHLLERFELSSDRTRLTYSYTLEDAVYLSEAVTGSVEWVHRPDLTYTGYACDPEVARRFLTE
jgi:hypothetical protein